MMNLDAKTIETLSVNAVKTSIVLSPLLDQFIAENDKEPSWDGHVYIYDKTPKQKKNLVGRMPVQVKGTQKDDFSKSEISFSMSIVDLRNYLKNGGIVLFVVYISPDGMKNKIYYAELTPIKLRILINQADKQKSKMVQLKQFPDDNNQKASIFLNCYQNCKKQASYIYGKLATLEELSASGLLEGLTIPISGAGIANPIAALLSSENYIYANIRGAAIPQPLEIIPTNITTRQILQASISVGGKEHYSSYEVIRNNTSTVFRFGESLTIAFQGNGLSYKVNYKCTSKLRASVIDIDFFLNAVEKKEIVFNGIRLPFNLKSSELKQFNFQAEKEKLIFVSRAARALDTLGYLGEIDIKDLCDEDIRNLNRLVIAFVDSQPVSGLNPDLPPIVKIAIGKIKFCVVLNKEGMAQGQYRMSNYFDSGLIIAYDNADGEKTPTSLYSILHANDLLEIVNLRVDEFLSSFQAFEGNENYNRANLFMLELISAYDLSGGKRADLLNVAKDFSEWIHNAPEGALDKHIRLLNEYQIIKRERELSSDEQGLLWNIVEDAALNWQYKVGAFLLLGQQIPAERAFANLTQAEQEEFKKYPICHFWKTTEDK